MKPDLSYEQLERRRRILRGIFLALAISLFCAGVAVLAVPPETAMDIAIPRAFWGIALLIAGFFVGLFSRLVP
jgi:uncharacterized membrane protein HdeD (DUF308 family)